MKDNSERSKKIGIVLTVAVLIGATIFITCLYMEFYPKKNGNKKESPRENITINEKLNITMNEKLLEYFILLKALEKQKKVEISQYKDNEGWQKMEVIE